MTLREEVIDLILLKDKDGATELIVENILKENKIYTIRDDNKSEVWIYKDGIYVPQGQSFIKEVTRNILGKGYTTHMFNNVISKIEADTYIEQEEFFKEADKREVAVQNGILNIFTKELTPFTSKKRFFNKLPIKYNLESKCPNITQFFKDVLSDKEDVEILFEILGFCLFREYKLERTFMFVGDGGNGKSRTLSLIKAFLGIENVCSIPLSNLTSESFSISEFHRKLVNLAGDLSRNDLKDTGVFKELSGGDIITAKRKFLSDLHFENYAKMIFACNDLPRVYDTSKGFWRRWVLLEFPYEFIREEEFNNLNKNERKKKKIADPEIIDKIVNDEELSGLLNKSLDGLNRILKNKNFSYSKGTQEVKDLWIRKSDSFMAFCLDKLEEDSEGRISKKDIRQHYGKYCKKHKVKGVSDKSIIVTLQELFGIVDEYTSNPMTDKQEWTWVGIKWKENKEK